MSSMRSTVFGSKVIEKITPELTGEVDKIIEELALDALIDHFNSCVVAKAVTEYVQAVASYEKNHPLRRIYRYELYSGACPKKENEIYAMQYILNSSQLHEANDIWLDNIDSPWKAVDQYFIFLKNNKNTKITENAVITDVANKIITSVRLHYPDRVIDEEKCESGTNLEIAAPSKASEAVIFTPEVKCDNSEEPMDHARNSALVGIVERGDHPVYNSSSSATSAKVKSSVVVQNQNNKTF